MQRSRQRGAHAVRILRRGVERIFAVRGVVDAERAARLDRIGGHPVVDEANLGDVLGTGESGVGRGLVAERNRHARHCRSGNRPRFSAALRFRRLFEIDHRRQRLIVDRHELGGIARLRFGFGDDEGDMIADAANAIGQQHRTRGRKALRAAPGFRHEERRNAADLVGNSIGAGEHTDDARRRFRGSHVDAFDHRMRVRREHRHAIALARQHKIADILAPAGGEALIFDPADSLSDAEFRHRDPGAQAQ